jgi:site-specific recombinase XerC
MIRLRLRLSPRRQWLAMLVRDQSCFSADSVGVSAARAQAEELDRMVHRGEADQADRS